MVKVHFFMLGRDALDRSILPLRVRLNFLNHFKLIPPVQSPSQKYSCFRPTQITGVSLPSRLIRGAYRDRHGREAGCGGRGGADNEPATEADGEDVWS